MGEPLPLMAFDEVLARLRRLRNASIASSLNDEIALDRIERVLAEAEAFAVARDAEAALTESDWGSTTEREVRALVCATEERLYRAVRGRQP